MLFGIFCRWGTTSNARMTFGHPTGDDASHAQDWGTVKFFGVGGGKGGNHHSVSHPTSLPEKPAPEPAPSSVRFNISASLTLGSSFSISSSVA